MFAPTVSDPILSLDAQPEVQQQLCAASLSQIQSRHQRTTTNRRIKPAAFSCRRHRPLQPRLLTSDHQRRRFVLTTPIPLVRKANKGFHHHRRFPPEFPAWK
uniref:Uncharacterized protein n=1 Tax=Trichuris muris TaxID=70415 RepID=A0A5S6QZ64_TRIMR